MQAVIAICGAIAAIGGIILLVMKVKFARQGQMKPAAKAATEIIKDGEKRAAKFHKEVVSGNVGKADGMLSDTLDDLDALGVRQGSPTKPAA